MYLNKYNYSTSFTDIVDKYKLPRHYLLKALTTGCPDDEYPEAKKWNSDLQKILDKEQVTLDEFKEKILRDYSNEPNKKFVNVFLHGLMLHKTIFSILLHLCFLEEL